MLLVFFCSKLYNRIRKKQNWWFFLEIWNEIRFRNWEYILIVCFIKKFNKPTTNKYRYLISCADTYLKFRSIYDWKNKWTTTIQFFLHFLSIDIVLFSFFYMISQGFSNAVIVSKKICVRHWNMCIYWNLDRKQY